MAQYNRDHFSTYPKKQLLDYVEQQNEQLARFETRFRGRKLVYLNARFDYNFVL